MHSEWKLSRSLGSSFAGRTCPGELGFKKLFERSQPGRNRLDGFKAACKRVCSLKAVAGDAQHGRFIRTDAALRIEFTSRGHGNAAGGFCDDTFVISQKRD